MQKCKYAGIFVIFLACTMYLCIYKSIIYAFNLEEYRKHVAIVVVAYISNGLPAAVAVAVLRKTGNKHKKNAIVVRQTVCQFAPVLQLVDIISKLAGHKLAGQHW